MDYFARVAAFSPALFLLLLFVLMFVAREVGYFFGRRHASDPEASHDGIGVIVGSMLALLAFVLALTLSSSSGRFQERRQATLDEANAIGTAWAVAQDTAASGVAEAGQIGALMADYTRVRRAFVAAPPDLALLAQLETCSSDLQVQMRGLAATVVLEHPNNLTRPLMDLLNTAFSASLETRFAFSARLQPQIFWLLMGMTALSIAGLGYRLGTRGRSLRVLSALIVLMWSAVVMEILDMGTARIGTILTDTSVYQWVLDDMAGPNPAGGAPSLPAACAAA